MGVFTDLEGRRALLITDLDLDGTAALVLQRYFQIPYETIRALDYGWEKSEELLSFAKQFEVIHMVDKSVEREEYEALINAGCEVHVFDHHDTSSWLIGLPNVYHDQTRCGTRIYFEDYIVPRVGRRKSIVDEFVTLVDTYDIWRKESPLWGEAQNMNRLLYKLYRWGAEEQIEKVENFVTFQAEKLELASQWFWKQSEQKKIQEAIAKENTVYADVCGSMDARVDTKGRSFYIAAASAKISITCSRILEENPEVDYMLIVNTFGGLNGRISLRSQKDVNLPELFHVAKGHPQAAGGEIDSKEAEALLKRDAWSLAYEDEYEEYGRNIISTNLAVTLQKQNAAVME